MHVFVCICVHGWSDTRLFPGSLHLTVRSVVLDLPNTVAFNTVQVVGTPALKLFSLLLQNCKFVTVMNCNVNVVFNALRWPLWKGSSFNPQRGYNSHALEVFPLTESGVPHLARLVVSMLQGSTCIPAPSLSWCSLLGLNFTQVLGSSCLQSRHFTFSRVPSLSLVILIT